MLVWVHDLDRYEHPYHLKPGKTEKPAVMAGLFSSGGRTRTYDLRVMSPTSYRLLYSAMWSAKVGTFFEIPKFF